MGKDLGARFKECIKSGKLKKSDDARALVEKELRVARSDLKTAEDGLAESRWKWCTIQAYYSMFHSARALLYSKGYVEKSHYCLRAAIESLFASTGELDERFVDFFQIAKVMRENADYEENFSDAGAQKIVECAKQFLAASKAIICTNQDLIK